MAAARPPDFASVVRASWRRTTGYVVASSPRCVALQRRSLAIVDRVLEAVRLSDLAGLRPAQSWFMGILLGPGDATEFLGGWARRLAAGDLTRLRFYVLSSTDLVAAFQGWYAVELPDPRRAGIDHWTHFPKQFGADLNNQVYRDATEHPEWFRRA